MKSVSSLLFGFLFSISAFGADHYEFKALGFSKDNSRFAFLESVISDGSGFPVAHVSVIDVKNNRLLQSTRISIEDDSVTELVKVEKMAIAKAQLSRFEIKPFQNLGTTLLNRLSTDFSRYSDTVFGPYERHAYELLVSQTPETVSNYECYFEGQETQALELKLKDLREPDLAPVVLQKDVKVPASRKCAHDYAVSKVYTNGKSLVVILTYLTPGFEGRNIEFMSVGAQTIIE